ncbi:MAG: hypothetical protein ACN2B6_03015 [Rickettsiales bacterium]
MVDVRLITILSQSQQVQGVTQPQVTQGGGSPNLLVNIPNGSILSGYIVNRDPSGNPILRSERGDIVFSSNFFLKIGSDVTIRVENKPGHTQARILTVNGQPPEVAQNQSAYARDQQVIIGKDPASARPGAAQPSDAVVRNPTGTTVTGTLLPPSAGSNTALPLPAGTQLALKIATITPPTAEGSPATSTQTSTTSTNTQTTSPNSYASYAKPNSTTNAPSAPTTGTAQTPATTSATANTTSTQATAPTATTPSATSAPPAAPSAPTAAPTVGSTIAATVVAKEPGAALLQTTFGNIRVVPGAVLPLGGKVTFQLVQLARPDALPAQATLPPAPLLELAHEWSSLKQILGLIDAHNKTAGESVLALPSSLASTPASPQALPLAQQMSAGLLLFISALRGGDFRNWMGRDNVEWLRRNGHEPLLQKAEGEFLTMARAFGDQPAHQWQTLVFPFIAAGEMQQARMFLKKDKRNTKDNDEEEDTRFVLEVELSQLGEMQMDGFVRKHEKTLEFDLIIRSHLPLNETMQNDILEIYNNIGELTGYQGTLQFQAVEEFPVSPLEEVAAEHLKNMLV